MKMTINIRITNRQAIRLEKKCTQTNLMSLMLQLRKKSAYLKLGPQAQLKLPYN